MKTSFVLALATSFLLANCASPVQRRVERNPELFAKLSESQKGNVMSGRVAEGMSKDAVFLAWGKPQRISVGKRNGMKTERWDYTGYEPVYRYDSDFGYGGSTGNYALAMRDHHERYAGDYRRGDFMYYSPAPRVDYVPYNAKMVEFTGEVVTAFVLPK
jgi:hypothetical protein